MLMQLWAAVAPHVVDVLALGVGFVLAFGRDMLADLIRSKVKHTATERALLVINDAVLTAVLAAEQTIVSSAKEHLADGRIDRAAYDRMLQQAKADVVESIVERLKEALSELGYKSHGSSIMFLRGRVESQVAALKLDRPNP